jgi:hypothetical protein
MTFDGSALIITGSLNVSAGITGSLFGTASYATQALSASYALTAPNYVTLTTSQSISGVKTFNPSVTASGAIARGTYYTPALVAAANGDSLVGLDINPTFTTGSFTGVARVAARVIGAGVIGNGSNANGRADTGLSVITNVNNSAIAVASATGASLHIENQDNTNNSYTNISLRTDNGGSTVFSNISLIKTATNSGSLRIHQQGVQQLGLYSNLNSSIK